MMKRLMNKKKYLAVLVPLLATATVYAEGLKALDDDQMSAQTGQALLNLSYIAPTDAANIESTRSGGDNNTGFYKLGIEAEMELNANIKNLQLGCGGVNGAQIHTTSDNLTVVASISVGLCAKVLKAVAIGVAQSGVRHAISCQGRLVAANANHFT